MLPHSTLTSIAARHSYFLHFPLLRFLCFAGTEVGSTFVFRLVISAVQLPPRLTAKSEVHQSPSCTTVTLGGRMWYCREGPPFRMSWVFLWCLVLFLVGNDDQTPEVNLQSGRSLPPHLGIMPAHGSCAIGWPSSPNETPFLLKAERLSENKRGK